MLNDLKSLIENALCGRCVINVSRQIGTTTALCSYAAKMVANGRIVIYHTDRSRSRDDVFEKIKKQVSELVTDKTVQIDSKEHMIKVMDANTHGAIEVTYGDRLCMPSAKHADIYIVDNADFFDGWEPWVGKIMDYNTKVIIASCPSEFTGHWSLFKKLYVKDLYTWKAFTLNTVYDSKLKDTLSSEKYDIECNNYRSFFDTASKIYKNIGDLLFMENKPFYENARIV